jgi:hypothetical protein
MILSGGAAARQHVAPGTKLSLRPVPRTMATISWSLSMPMALNMIATGMSSPTSQRTKGKAGVQQTSPRHITEATNQPHAMRGPIVGRTPCPATPGTQRGAALVRGTPREGPAPGTAHGDRCSNRKPRPPHVRVLCRKRYFPAFENKDDLVFFSWVAEVTVPRVAPAVTQQQHTSQEHTVCAVLPQTPR